MELRQVVFTLFQLVGQEIVNNFKCDKWRTIITNGEKVNKYTMYLRWKVGS